MRGELKRNAVRILSNYARLGATFIFGILLVPILIGHLGLDGFGLWGLIGATVGFADMFREIVRSSMNRELAAAYHDPDPEVFPRVYNAAVAIALGAAALASLVYVGIWFLLPYLQIPDELMGAARVVVISQGVYSVLFVALAPQFNMYIATERMVLNNTWQALDRGTHLLSAVILFLIVGIEDPARGLSLYAALTAAMGVCLILAAVTVMGVLERRTIPRPSLVSRRGIRSILHTVGWNGVVVTSTNLHIRLDQLLLNLFFGVWANGVFTVGVRLTGYVRMLAQGMTDGLDAVSARISTTSQDNTLLALIRHSTRLHALVAFPACVLVLYLAEPMITLWVGKRLKNPEEDVPFAVAATTILVVGSTARAVGDGWIRILYGAGFVRRYATWILLAGVLNPIVAVALIWLLPSDAVRPVFDKVSGPAMAYAATTLLAYFGFVPFVAARCIGQSPSRFFRPLLRPVIATALATPVLVAAANLPWEWSLAKLAVVCAAFGGAYGLLALFIAINADERARLLGLLKRAGRRGPRATPGRARPAAAPPAPEPEASGTSS